MPDNDLLTPTERRQVEAFDCELKAVVAEVLSGNRIRAEEHRQNCRRLFIEAVRGKLPREEREG